MSINQNSRDSHGISYYTNPFDLPNHFSMNFETLNTSKTTALNPKSEVDILEDRSLNSCALSSVYSIKEIHDSIGLAKESQLLQALYERLNSRNVS